MGKDLIVELLTGEIARLNKRIAKLQKKLNKQKSETDSDATTQPTEHLLIHLDAVITAYLMARPDLSFSVSALRNALGGNKCDVEASLKRLVKRYIVVSDGSDPERQKLCRIVRRI